MKRMRALRARGAAVAAVVVVGAACGGTVSVPGSDAGVSSDAGGSSSGAVDAGTDAAPIDTTGCALATDCGFGEIDHEIQSASDCVCLFGCPYIPLNKTTIDRRNAQYKTHCTPGKDGNGQPCPVDDCASPPQPVCKAGKCAAP
jgi:hypothetical protein